MIAARTWHLSPCFVTFRSTMVSPGFFDSFSIVSSFLERVSDAIFKDDKEKQEALVGVERGRAGKKQMIG